MDVASYPEVTDLLLAADVVVLGDSVWRGDLDAVARAWIPAERLAVELPERLGSWRPQAPRAVQGASDGAAARRFLETCLLGRG